MRKNVYGLFALMLAFLFSCSNEDFEGGKREGMVDFTINTSIPQGIKTYASENGGATNVDASEFDLRYIMEVWTTDGTNRLAYRGYKIVTDNFATTDVTFSVRLLAKKYDFVFWADFVKKGETKDFFYSTSASTGAAESVVEASEAAVGNGLKEIEMLFPTEFGICNDVRDAFFANATFDLTEMSALGKVKLFRPFGKYRLIATDKPDGYLTAAEAKKITVNYAGNGAKLYKGFNALDGTVSKQISMGDYAASIDLTPELNVAIGGTLYPEIVVLAFDYIFAPELPDVQTIAFKTSVYSDLAATQLMGFRDIANIPIQRNKLTTIIGNFFTNMAVMNVIVDDMFDGEADGSPVKAENVAKDFKAGDPCFEIPTTPVAGTPPIPELTYVFTGTIEELCIVDKDAGAPFEGIVNIAILNPAGKVDINLPMATVKFLGTVGTLTAITANSTLEILKASNITTLNVNGGIAEVYGKVGTATESGTGKVFWGVASWEDIVAAIARTDANDGIVFAKNIKDYRNFYVAKAGYIVDGKGFTFSGHFTKDIYSGVACRNAIIINANDVTVKNLTITNTQYNAISVNQVTGAILDNITVKNNACAGVIVNGAEVALLKNFTSSGNGWNAGINLGQGSGVLGIPKITALEGTINISDAAPIYADFAGATETTFDHTGWYCAERVINLPKPDKFVWKPGTGTTVITVLSSAANYLKSIIESLNPGDEVVLSAGTYTLIAGSTSIVVPEGVTITGEPGVVIKAPSTSAPNPMFTLTGKSNVTFDGIDFDLSGQVVKGIQSNSGSTNIVVKNCEFSGAGMGSGSSSTYVYYQNSVSPQIENNVFNGVTDKAVYLENISGNTVVSGNQISNGTTTNGALQFDDCIGTITITNNVITNISSKNPGPGSSEDKGAAIDLYGKNSKNTNNPTIVVSGNTITNCDRGIFVYKCNGQITIEDNPISGSSIFDVGFDSLGGVAYTVNITVTNSGTDHEIRNAWGADPSSMWANLKIDTDGTPPIHINQ